MTLDEDDVKAIAEEVVRLLSLKMGMPGPDQEPKEQAPIIPGSYEARKREALQRGAANRERREKREREKQLGKQ